MQCQTPCVTTLPDAASIDAVGALTGAQDESTAGADRAEEPGARPRRWLRRPRIRLALDAIAVILAWKAASLFLLLCAATLFRPQYDLPPGDYDVTFGQAFHNLRTALTGNWDSAHYVYIAEHDYEPGTSFNAFYPLYPLSIRALNQLTGDSYASAMLISNLASLLAAYL